jgi:hypothetical protein
MYQALHASSQQGLKYLNDKFKLMFFNNTQRSGNCGENTDEA